MKIRLESQKTSLRISKSEFEKLLADGKLETVTLFPNGEKLALSVTLSAKEELNYRPGSISIALPNRDIQDHKPSKTGLSYYFQLDNMTDHELLFEVDIKRKPLGSKARK